MSADHRKPVAAFVVLAFFAAALVGVHRADAQAGRFLAAVVGSEVRAQGAVAGAPGSGGDRRGVSDIGPTFPTLSGGPSADDAPPDGLSWPKRSDRVSRDGARDGLPGRGVDVADEQRTRPASSTKDLHRPARKAPRRASETPAASRGADGPGMRRHDRRSRQHVDHGESRLVRR